MHIGDLGNVIFTEIYFTSIEFMRASRKLSESKHIHTGM
jgi:hypothetical protein